MIYWRSAHACIRYGTHIYVFGGADESGYGMWVSERYDLAKNRWAKIEPMPQTSLSNNGVCYNDRIYIVGR